MPHVYVLQHIAIETLGIIAPCLENAGCTCQYVRSYAGEPLPQNMEGASGLIVMGGPMGVYETSRYPFLVDEMRLIESALRAGKPVLGICLGSQLMAEVLGSRVRKGKVKEIGWFDLKLSDLCARDALWQKQPSLFKGFLWHGDYFECPQGAVCLVSSDNYDCQAFRYRDQAYGFLFHMESTHEIIRAMIREFKKELTESGGQEQEILDCARDLLPGLHEIGSQVFSHWVAKLKRV